MDQYSEQEKKLEELLPVNTMKTRVPQTHVDRIIKPARSRYRNEISKYVIFRSDACDRCGKCAEVCPHGVHVLKYGYKYFAAPKGHACRGPACKGTDHYCVDIGRPKNGSKLHHNLDPVFRSGILTTGRNS